jgi:2-methylcitrate dehydratase PrpD
VPSSVGFAHCQPPAEARRPHMNISAQVAEHIANTRTDSLPGEAIKAAKRLMLDTLGVAWAGSNAPGIPETRQLIMSDGGKGESVVWAFGDYVPATPATFLNSCLAAALDYDSVHQAGQVHADVIALPAALAVAQRQHASGSDFMAAFVIGADLICRLGKSVHKNSGWFFTSIHGVMGAAAAAARLLNLDVGATANALGISLSHVGGTQQALVEKTLTKRLQAGFAARGGVLSALLAANGISGPKEALEGKFGFYAMYEQGTAEKLLDGLGRRYEVLSTTTKKYPSCTCNHTLIEGVIQIVTELDLSKDDVESVEVFISPFMGQLIGAPFDPSGNLQVTAQFNAQYSVASAILRRCLGIAEIQDKAVLEPAITELVKRVKVTVDERNTGKFAPTEIVLRSKRHGDIRRHMKYVPGTPENPMSDAEHQAKFLECTTSGTRPLSRTQSAEIIRRVSEIESLPDMSLFFDGVI